MDARARRRARHAVCASRRSLRSRRHGLRPHGPRGARKHPWPALGATDRASWPACDRHGDEQPRKTARVPCAPRSIVTPSCPMSSASVGDHRYRWRALGIRDAPVTAGLDVIDPSALFEGDESASACSPVDRPVQRTRLRTRMTSTRSSPLSPTSAPAPAPQPSRRCVRAKPPPTATRVLSLSSTRESCGAGSGSRVDGARRIA